MKKFTLFLFGLSIICNFLPAQNNQDSLILFSDLKFHSQFERVALDNFVHNQTDTFNLFLAIDENMNADIAAGYHKTYMELFDELNEKNIADKKINKKIKTAYSSVHSKFLTKYNGNEYFPVMFQSGTYNCVSASMIYSLVFDELDIPYKVMASPDHVYLIANPGSNSVVIETTNPSLEKAIFTGEFKQRYAMYLRSSKIISDAEYKNKSVEEIFEEHYNEVKEVEFFSLPGFQYYNKALSKLQNNEIEEALTLCQKAYFFYPDQQVKTLLYTALLYHIEDCDFDRVTDIDYLLQLSKFEDTESDLIVGIFSNLINHFLQYTDKEQYCDSLYRRFSSQIQDKRLLEEISFSYFMQMSYRFQNSNKVEYYVTNALKLKGNHHDANVMMDNELNRKFNSIYNGKVFLDTLKQMELRYNFEPLISKLEVYRTIAILKNANDAFNEKDFKTGDLYLQEFENTCEFPVESEILKTWIERTYHAIAVQYFYKDQKTKARNIINMGLKYVPNSRLLNSTDY